MDEEHTLVMAPPEAKKFESGCFIIRKIPKTLRQFPSLLINLWLSMDGKFIRPVMMKNWVDGQTSAW